MKSTDRRFFSILLWMLLFLSPALFQEAAARGTNALQQWLDNYNSPDPDKQNAALDTLMWLPGKNLAKFAVTKFTSEHAEVRRNALVVVAVMLGEKRIITINADGNDESIVPPHSSAQNYTSEVESLLQDPDPSVRGQALETAAQLVLPDINKYIETGLTDSTPRVVNAALTSILIRKSKEFSPSIVPIMNSTDADLRGWSRHVLAKVGGTDYVDQIATGLQDSDIDVIENTMMALTELNATQYWNQILVHIDQEEDWLVMGVLSAMDQFGKVEENADKLEPIFDRKWMADRAIRLAGRYKLVPYKARIAKFVADKNNRDSGIAAWALGQLGAKEFGPMIARILTNDSPWDVDYAAEALAELGLTQFLPQMQQAWAVVKAKRGWEKRATSIEESIKKLQNILKYRKYAADLILNYVAGRGELTDAQKANADWDGDGTITVFDAFAILSGRDKK